jgi:hypothetical protein
MARDLEASDVRRVFSVINKMRDDGIVENYAVGGAVASVFYLEPFTTADIDIFITLKSSRDKKLLSLQPIYDYLRKMGAKLDGAHVIYAGWPLQFLPANSPLVEEALDQAKEIDAEGVSIRVFRLAHLAAIALEVGRKKDKFHLDRYIESHAMDMREFRAILRRHGLEGKYEDWLKWQKTF